MREPGRSTPQATSTCTAERICAGSHRQTHGHTFPTVVRACEEGCSAPRATSACTAARRAGASGGVGKGKLATCMQMDTHMSVYTWGDANKAMQLKRALVRRIAGLGMRQEWV